MEIKNDEKASAEAAGTPADAEYAATSTKSGSAGETGATDIPGGGATVSQAVPEADAAAASSGTGDAPDAETGAGDDDPGGALEEQVATLEQEKQELRDRLLRSAADFDNLRKRSRKEVVEAASRGREELLKELLAVIDNLERAVTHGEGEAESPGSGLLDGVRMVLRQFLGALEKFEVRPFGAVGQAFDPQFHAAVQQVPTDEHPPGMVVEEYQRGYKVGERLLRPSMVAVATPPPEGSTGSGASPEQADGATSTDGEQ